MYEKRETYYTDLELYFNDIYESSHLIAGEGFERSFLPQESAQLHQPAGHCARFRSRHLFPGKASCQVVGNHYY